MITWRVKACIANLMGNLDWAIDAELMNQDLTENSCRRVDAPRAYTNTLVHATYSSRTT